METQNHTNHCYFKVKCPTQAHVYEHVVPTHLAASVGRSCHLSVIRRSWQKWGIGEVFSVIGPRDPSF